MTLHVSLRHSLCLINQNHCSGAIAYRMGESRVTEVLTYL